MGLLDLLTDRTTMKKAGKIADLLRDAKANPPRNQAERVEMAEQLVGNIHKVATTPVRKRKRKVRKRKPETSGPRKPASTVRNEEPKTTVIVVEAEVVKNG